MTCHDFMCVVVKHREKNAVKVQEILTKYGCIIRVRLGLHEVREDQCEDEGIIMLNLCGKEEEMKKLQEELNAVEGVFAERIHIEPRK
ncbi:MAG TPA: hypothetical protein ENM97_02075 [Moorella mulderi]|nr:hypothetical protein [Moorella mulderi]